VVAATSGLLKDAGCVVYGARLWFDPNSTENMTEAEPFAPLSELERDAIAELANVAMGPAAASLRKMVGSAIVLSVPKVEILDVQALTDEFAPEMANVPRVRRIGSRWAYCDDLFVVANRFVTKLRHSPLQRGRLVLRPPPCFPLCLDNLSLRKRGFFLRSIQSAQRIRIVSLRHGRRCAPGWRVGWGARHRGPCHLRIQRSRIA
jgi:hypothetical protein